jgi:nicotinamide-nucleotide amidase
VVNIPESVLSTRLIAFEKQLPLNVKLAYLPHLNTVRLRLTCHAKTSEQAQELLNIQADILRQIVHDDLASEGNENPTEQLAADLLSHRLTIATAESCTGGYLAHKLTSVPGSSSYFEGSIISYSYGVKEKLLGVASETMEKKGAVSEEVVLQMAASLKHQLNTDYAIAISGIAGPGGATPSKPVGTVWICIMNNEQTVTRLFHFSGDRHQIVERTTNMAIEMTRRMIGGKPLPDSF